MEGFAPEDIAADLLQRHADLEALQGDGAGGDFLSGWQCDNPWRNEISKRVLAERIALDDSRYVYIEDDASTIEGLSAFHFRADGTVPESIFCASGASAVLFSFCAHLRQSGIEEVFYIPPLYFTAHAALRTLGIRARPVSGRQAFETDFRPNWPDQRCVLLLCDPIWYAGMRLSEAFVADLAAWQATTGSLVFVDGSFQYMRWDGSVGETTAKLDPALTIRLLCATKALAMHGYRFAHALVPSPLQSPILRVYSRIYGSTSADNVAFGRVAASLLQENEVSRGLAKEAARRHARLRQSGAISAPWEADCGYFVFEQLRLPPKQLDQLMDGTYFEQRRYPDCRRLNLLSPRLGALG